MDLVIDGVQHLLGLHEPLSFAGASRASCSPLAGPVRDLDVTTRNDRLLATVAIRDLSGTRPIAVDGRQVLALLTGSGVVVGADGSRAGLHLLDAVCPCGWLRDPAGRRSCGSKTTARPAPADSMPGPAKRR